MLQQCQSPLSTFDLANPARAARLGVARRTVALAPRLDGGRLPVLREPFAPAQPIRRQMERPDRLLPRLQQQDEGGNPRARPDAAFLQPGVDGSGFASPPWRGAGDARTPPRRALFSKGAQTTSKTAASLAGRTIRSAETAPRQTRPSVLGKIGRTRAACCATTPPCAAAIDRIPRGGLFSLGSPHALRAEEDERAEDAGRGQEKVAG